MPHGKWPFVVLLLSAASLMPLARLSADETASLPISSELGELREMTAAVRGAGSDQTLRLQVEKPARYAWAVLPAPKQGWNLKNRERVEVEIANRGAAPAEVLFWIVGVRGWDAVCDAAKLAPGESRLFSCRLRAAFPDGTPKLDPGQIKQLQIMVAKASPGTTLEVRGLRATGKTGDWIRPTGRLEVPPVEDGPPLPGHRVRFRLPQDEDAGIYSLLYLPSDWKPGGTYPVIVEYPGNIYLVATCYSTGMPDQCVIGYGMTQGRGAIWVSLPFLDRKDGKIVENGWGNADDTADYAVRMVEAVCANFGGDHKNIVLTGFSRGAIACGYIGLRNDRIAPLWKGFHACQHYDGDGWNGATMPSALERAARFKGTAVFQTDNPAKTFQPLMDTMKAKATYAQSGLGAHACAMFLDDRPSTVQLRAWFRELVAEKPSAKP